MTRDGCRKAKEGRGKAALWGLVLALTTVAPSQPAGGQPFSPALEQANLKITLRMYNYGISRALLARAEGEATAILNHARLGVAWVDCPLTPAEFENYPACQKPMGPADFAVRVLTAGEAERFTAHHEALGQALECPRDQIGCSAYILYRGVLELARDGDATEAQLLGHALAHEIGHLLLGPNSHSAIGIMRGIWNHQDLQTIARAYLFFTEPQSARMRNQVAARSTIRQDQVATVRKP
jgi:hypothetical protein